jgi:hypothetical protein
MRKYRVFAIFLAATLLVFSSTCARAQDAPIPETSKQAATQELVLRGKLARSMAIGGESTGWTLEFAKEKTVGGKKLSSIEISGAQKRLEKFADQNVKVRGTLKHMHTVERGEWMVLVVNSIQPSDKPATPQN